MDVGRATEPKLHATNRKHANTNTDPNCFGDAYGHRDSYSNAQCYT
jgi:hypothetical protein